MCRLGEVGEQHEGCNQRKPHHSHGKRPTAFNLLIKFRTSGHGGLDWASHSGVNSVSHDRHVGHAYLGWTEWLSIKPESSRQWSSGRCGFLSLCQKVSLTRKQLIQIIYLTVLWLTRYDSEFHVSSEQHSTSAMKYKMFTFPQSVVTSSIKKRHIKTFTLHCFEWIQVMEGSIPYMISCSPPSTTSTCPVM